MMIPYWLKDLKEKYLPSKPDLTVTCEFCDGKGQSPTVNTTAVNDWEVIEYQKCSKCNGKGRVLPEQNMSEGI